MSKTTEEEKFNVHGSSDDRTSPRTLSVAFENFCDFTVVSRVFSKKLVKDIMDRAFVVRNSRGRIVHEWRGGLVEIGRGRNAVTREGRFDMALPRFLVDELRLEERLAPLIARLRNVARKRPSPDFRTHDLVRVPAGGMDQRWHMDHAEKEGTRRYGYFTILVGLNKIPPECGGTQIRTGSGNVTIVLRPGDALVFHGSLLHRGLGNGSKDTDRYFYYASFSSVEDENVVS